MNKNTAPAPNTYILEGSLGRNEKLLRPSRRRGIRSGQEKAGWRGRGPCWQEAKAAGEGEI